jgi:hypothetical protein
MTFRKMVIWRGGSLEKVNHPEKLEDDFVNDLLDADKLIQEEQSIPNVEKIGLTNEVNVNYISEHFDFGENIEIDQSLLEKIQAIVAKDGLEIIIAKTPEDFEYLKIMNAKALYMEMGAGKGSMLISPNISRAEVVEEIIHHYQQTRHGVEYFKANRNLLEIEAQKELIEYGKMHNWTVEELNEIKSALDYWEQLNKN